LCQAKVIRVGFGEVKHDSAGRMTSYCEERERRSNRPFACCLWMASRSLSSAAGARHRAAFARPVGATRCLAITRVEALPNAVSDPRRIFLICAECWRCVGDQRTGARACSMGCFSTDSQDATASRPDRSRENRRRSSAHIVELILGTVRAKRALIAADARFR